MKNRLLYLLSAAALLFALAAYGSVPSWTVEGMQNFYSGRSVYLSTNERPGSESENVCRLTLPFFNDYMKGAIILQNKRGNGGVEGLNWVYERPDPDGIELGEAVLLNVLLNKITELPGANYDPNAFDYLFGISSEKFVFMVSEEGPYNSIEDLKAASGLKLGGTSAQGPIALSAMSSCSLLDLDAKVITGYSNTGELILGLLSGELAALCVPIHLASSADGVKVLFTLSSERDPIFPDAPALPELMQISADKQQLFDLWDKLLLQSHVFYASPGTDPDKLEFLRGMAGVLAGSSKFLDDVGTLLSLPVVAGDIIPGEQMQKIVADTMENAPRIKSILQSVLDNYKA